MVKGIKKGFTLIELLAVIIILAIIALFATPKIMDVIEDSRDSANKSTVYGIIDAAKLYYADSIFDDEKRLNIGDNKDIYDLMIVNGEKPEQGTLFVNDQGKVAISVTIGKKCYVKNYDTNLEIYSFDDENCDLNFEQVVKNYKCIRATELHTEECKSACSSAGYTESNKGTTITYGSLGTKGVLTSGDAFDCDVNGDGLYDLETERFYYVTDLDENKNYAVLIYSDNVKQGVIDNTYNGATAYETTGNVYLGPVNAITYLPTTEQWSNVELYSKYRDIKNEYGTNIGYQSTGKQDFSYEGYAARLLTAVEMAKTCGTNLSSSSSGDLDKCMYFLENTSFANSSNMSNGYWLESIHSYYSNYAWYVYPYYRYISYTSPTASYSVRPVIEVLKSDIDYGVKNTYTITYDLNGGTGDIQQTLKDENVDVRITGLVPERDGFIFLGWGEEASSNVIKYNSNDIYSNNESKILYAVWKHWKTIDYQSVCRRATVLHTEECTAYGCNQAGFTTSGSKGTTTITYGQLGNGPSLKSGDAFDCDVNGDGVYDSNTERFYYVSDYYDSESKTFNANYAVLVYSNNLYVDDSENLIIDNTYNRQIAYNSSSNSYDGPVTASKYLPTTEHWSNVSLYKSSRLITDYIGKDYGVSFDYSNYSARLLTTEEINSGCGIITGKRITGELDKCNYLLENTYFSNNYVNNDTISYGYWTETLFANSASYVGYVNGYSRYVYDGYYTNSNAGVRPVIEVAKSDIYLGKENYNDEDLIIAYDIIGEKGVDDWYITTPYVTINVVDNKTTLSNYKWCQGIGCNPEDTNNIETKSGKIVAMIDTTGTQICTIATGTNGLSTEKECTDIIKVDSVIPMVSINNSIINYKNVLQITIQPSISVSGYTYKWYKDNNLIEGNNSLTHTTSFAGDYKFNVTTGAGITKNSDTISTSKISDELLCKRAVELHTETCENNSTTNYCGLDGYSQGSTISYGNLVQLGKLNIGDAFDCDVNGDGVYDAETERFYYLTDLESDPDYAVLIYSENVIDGLINNDNSGVAFGINYQTIKDPGMVVDNLPTTIQWGNVTLHEPIRKITNENGGGNYNSKFSYYGYAARLVTMKELSEACGFAIGTTSNGILKTCNYLLENTQYSNSSNMVSGFWTENPSSKYSYSVNAVNAKSSSISSTGVSAKLAIRPVIEVPKIDLDYRISVEVSFDIQGEKGNDDWYITTPYVTINVIDSKYGIDSYKWCQGLDCIPSNVETESGKTVALLDSIGTQVCVIATNNANESTGKICTDELKIDTIKPSVVISQSPSEYLIALTGQVSPITNLSGYNYSWYKDDKILNNLNTTEILVSKKGIYKLKVTTGAGIESYSNGIELAEDIEVPFCKKATTLHTETCDPLINTYYCSGTGYSVGDTITYGQFTTNGTLKSGDAFDCDVNGDGIFDSNTERFYYVSDLYDTNTKTFDNEYATLIYYNNTIKGSPSNSTSTLSRYSSSYNTSGPNEAKKHLPTVGTWNSRLKTTSRQILLPNNNSFGSITGTYGIFSYNTYAARLLTTQEIDFGCGTSIATTPDSEATGILDNCIYLLENTKYAIKTGTYGYFLENPTDSINSYYSGYCTDAQNRKINSSNGNRSVRPAIEVKKENIDYGTITFNILGDKGNDNWYITTPYVTINANYYNTKLSYYKWCSGVNCNPTNEETESGKIVALLDSNATQVCAIAYDENGVSSGKVCTDVLKVDSTIPKVEISNSSNTLSNSVNPSSTVSGYIYQWYKDGNILKDSNSRSLNVTENGIYKLKVSTIAGNESFSNEIDINLENSTSIVCRRASTLHIKPCSFGTDSPFCNSTLSETGDAIAYGQLGSGTTLNSGDAFDCDVNGDGEYDAETERFYYVTDLEDNYRYAVMIYYNNTKSGVPDGTSTALSKYSINEQSYNGPDFGVTNLPTTEQWPSVKLTNTTQAIYNEYGGNLVYNVYKTNPAFSYEGYAARFLTYQEVMRGCKNTNIQENLNDCIYLLENTTFDSSENVNAYWLATPFANSKQYAWSIYGRNKVMKEAVIYANYTAVRPAIEVLKTNIDYGTGTTVYQASISEYNCSEGGTLSSDNKQCTLTTTATLDCEDGYQLVDNMCHKIDDTKKTTDIVCALASDGYEKCTNWNSTNPGRHNHCVKKTDDAVCPDGYVMDSYFDTRTHCVPQEIQSCGSSQDCVESYRNQVVLKVCPNGGTIFTGNEYPEDEQYIGECYTYSTETTIVTNCSDGYMLNGNNCVSNTGTSASSCAKGTINSEGKCVYTYNSTPNYYCPNGGTLNGTICEK